MAMMLRKFVSSEHSPIKQQQPRLKTTTPRSRANSSGTVTPPDSPTRPLRARFNSRDIPRTYSGQYAQAPENFLPLECDQQSQAVQQLSFSTVCYLYGSMLLTLNVISTVCIAMIKNGTDPYFQTGCWTLTAALHATIHFAGVHWTKGAWTIGQGEMNGWTVWEQLEATPESDAQLRRLLTVVPLLLALAACYISKFDKAYCAINIVLCALQIVPKFSFMNGVRLFGINRTAGIDDE